MAITPIDDDYINSIIKSAGPYNPDLNETQGIKLRELIKLLRDQIQQGGGQSAPQSVTYAQLMDLVNGNLLVPTRQYLITDFASRFCKFTLLYDDATKINSFDIDYSEGNRYSGPNEPILVVAKTTNTILDRAYSTLYPNHVLNYTLNNITTGVTVSDKGTILRRVDLVRNVNINFDFMAMRCSRQSDNGNLPRLAILIEKCVNFYGDFVGYYGATNACYVYDVLNNSQFSSDYFTKGIALGAMIDSTIATGSSTLIVPGLTFDNCKIDIGSHLELAITRGTIKSLSVYGNTLGDLVASQLLVEYTWDRWDTRTEKSIYFSSTGGNYLRTIGPDGDYIVTPLVS